MSRINTTAKTFTPAQFEEALKQFDVNKDGQLDAKDLVQMYNSINKFAPNICTNQRIRDLQTMLLMQGDGKINKNDVSSQASPQSHNAYTPAQGSSSEKAELRSKLENMEKLQQADLNDLSKPFQSDDAARELVLHHSRLLKHASFKDKTFLLLVLRDAGAGEWAHVGPQDQKAILNLLASVDPKDRNTLLEMAGGAKLMGSFMKGANVEAFNKLMQGAPKATPATKTTMPAGTISSQSTSAGASTSTSSSSTKGSTSTTNGSTSASTASASTPTTSSSGGGPLAQSPEFRAAMKDLRGASESVADLWKKYRDPNTSKEDKKDLMMKIQEAQSWEQQLYQFVSNMIKSQHQIAMGIIRNMP